MKNVIKRFYSIEFTNGANEAIKCNKVAEFFDLEVTDIILTKCTDGKFLADFQNYMFAYIRHYLQINENKVVEDLFNLYLLLNSYVLQNVKGKDLNYFKSYVQLYYY